MLIRDLTPTKAERSSVALRVAAERAEQERKWLSAAELYEAAGEVWPVGARALSGGDISKMLRKAEQCRQMFDLAGWEQGEGDLEC
ncbi:hypothetical protein [Stutzerimonas kunmingensis]|uniref:hypothetical protein n=1 Tax=Stutzerimonas kunmingensis TaxID=1211807 RepID=UPI0028AC6708|nr:hypothetical protein [Stutzerimonas kunmingensis]